MKQLTLICVFAIFILTGCRKVDVPQLTGVDLGKVPASTSISNLTQNGNTITAEFTVTEGAKYSVQITPFGSDKATKVDGFTAGGDKVIKTYDFSNLKKMDYDLILIDIDGKETKRPIIIK